MATLEKIRNKAGLLVIVVGLALFAFIIGDFLNSGSTYFRQSQEKVLTINGKVINIQDYQLHIDELSEFYKMQYGVTSVPEQVNTQIRATVYQTLLREKVIADEMAKLGMTISSEELFDMVQGENISTMISQNPMFQNPETQQFDKMTLLNFLKAIDDSNIEAYPVDQRAQLLQARSFWLYVEKNIKQARSEEKYTTLLSKAMSANKLEAQDAFNANAKSSDVAFVYQSYASVSDSTISVSRNEVEKLYNQRKEEYKQAESKVLKVLAVDITPSQADYDKAESDIQNLKSELIATDNVIDLVNENSEIPFENVFSSQSYLTPEVYNFVANANIGDVEGPVFTNDQYNMYKLLDKKEDADSVKISHIVLAGMTDARTAELADSLKRELDNNADFASLASTYSMDQTASTGGDLDWFNEAGFYRYFGEDFKNAVFEAKVGDVKIVKSMYGTHIVKVTDRTKRVPKYKVAQIQMTVTPSSSTYSDIYNALNSFVSNNNTIAKLTENASEAGYEVGDQTVTATQENLMGMQSSRQVIRWAFQNDKGKISDIFECENKFVIAGVDATLPEGYTALATVEPLLRMDLANQKKGEKIVAGLKAQNLTSLDAYATAMSSKVDSVKFTTFGTAFLAGIGFEPVFNGVSAITSLNSISEPFSGLNGVYVLKPYQVNEESGVAYDEKEMMTSLNTTKATNILTQRVMQHLIDNAEIVDNRIRFY